jgi:hypothetical protein
MGYDQAARAHVYTGQDMQPAYTKKIPIQATPHPKRVTAQLNRALP